jgi:transposase
MKEDLRTLWNYLGEVSAEHFLDDWVARAKVSGIRILQSFDGTIHDDRRGIMAWYDHPISTGPLDRNTSSEIWSSSNLRIWHSISQSTPLSDEP